MKIEFGQAIDKPRIYDVDGVRSVCVFVDVATELIIPEEEWNQLVGAISEVQQKEGSPIAWAQIEHPDTRI